ncbi:hypothetical protein NDU88_005274 [Pleurodeles waltl]|uniref:Uncharacterized protein n=1 Tax=Pleurodeles waltl TaxID=8319 RepID=A0AAV7TAC7_PLEWA|nr:hypothetical protein NDU88_005274 [Pleurodeles waltl]
MVASTEGHYQGGRESLHRLLKMGNISPEVVIILIDISNEAYFKNTTSSTSMQHVLVLTLPPKSNYNSLLVGPGQREMLKNQYVSGYFDGVLLFEYVLQNLLQNKSLITPDTFLDKFRNLSIQGVWGPLILDDVGDRDTNFTLLYTSTINNQKSGDVMEGLAPLHYNAPGAPKVHLTREKGGTQPPQNSAGYPDGSLACGEGRWSLRVYARQLLFQMSPPFPTGLAAREHGEVAFLLRLQRYLHSWRVTEEILKGRVSDFRMSFGRLPQLTLEEGLTVAMAT